MSTRRTLSIGLLAGAAPGSPSRLPHPRSSGSRTPPIVTVVAREYSFDAPEFIEAGPTTVRLVSAVASSIRAVRQDREPAYFDGFQANPNGTRQGVLGSRPWEVSAPIQPGGTAMTTIDLAPGLYALVRDMEDAKGTPHIDGGHAA